MRAGLRQIGKERVYMAIAEALDCKIFVDSGRRALLECAPAKVPQRLQKDPVKIFVDSGRRALLERALTAESLWWYKVV